MTLTYFHAWGGGGFTRAPSSRCDGEWPQINFGGLYPDSSRSAFIDGIEKGLLLSVLTQPRLGRILGQIVVAL